MTSLDSPSPTPAAGWYPEPNSSGVLRYWNGSAWEDWRQPTMAAPIAPVRANGVAVTSLVFSLVAIGLDLTIIGGFLGFPCSIVGLVCGRIALNRSNTLGRRGMALWGFWLGLVALIIQVVIVIVFIAFQFRTRIFQ